MPYSPLIQKESRGCCCLATRPQIRARDGFLICVRENAPPSHSKRTQAIPAGVRGGMRHIVWFQCVAPQNWSDYQQLYEGFHECFQGSDFIFSRVENQAGERQCVKRPAGFTADGRADRISSRFDRICSFFRAYRLEKGSVSSTRIIAESVCQPYARFRKTGGFFACLRAFPVCQVYTQKNQYLCNQGGSVCIRWTMGGFTMNPQCELYKRKNI